jgi:hypothetical protein
MNRNSIASRLAKLEAQQTVNRDDGYNARAEAWVRDLLAGRDPGPVPLRDARHDPRDAWGALVHSAAVRVYGDLAATCWDDVPARRWPAGLPDEVLVALNGFATAMEAYLQDVARMEAAGGPGPAGDGLEWR